MAVLPAAQGVIDMKTAKFKQVPELAENTIEETFEVHPCSYSVQHLLTCGLSV